MLVELDKKDLIALAKGCSPNFSIMNNPLIKKYGSYNGSYGNWSWNYNCFEECSEEEIFEIYQICKHSWK